MAFLGIPLFDSMLVVLGVGAFGYLAWQKTTNGIYLVALFLPTYLIRLRIGSLPTTVLELAIVTLFVIWVVKDGRWKRINIKLWKVRNVENPIPAAFRLPLILMLITAAIAVLISPNTLQGLGLLKAYFIEPLLFLIVCSYEIRTPKQALRITAMLGIATVTIGLVGVWQSITGLGIPNYYWKALVSRRITTFFGYPNANSLFVAPIAAFFIGRLLMTKKLSSVVGCAVVIGFGIITVSAAKTSGALVALAFIAWLLLIRVNKTRTFAAAIAIIAFTLVVHGALSSASWRMALERISTNYLNLDSTSVEIRINQWRETIALLGAHPFAGAGLAGYQTALEPFHRYRFLEIYLYPHNIFLNFWVELGLLGLVAFLWLTAAIAHTLWRALRGNNRPAIKKWAAALALVWIVIYLHGLVDVPYFKNDLSILFIIFLLFTMKLKDSNFTGKLA